MTNEQLETIIYCSHFEVANGEVKIKDAMIGIMKAVDQHTESLKKDVIKLRTLEAAGVYNWEGYEHAIESLNDD